MNLEEATKLIGKGEFWIISRRNHGNEYFTHGHLKDINKAIEKAQIEQNQNTMERKIIKIISRKYYVIGIQNNKPHCFYPSNGNIL